jgi:uncharacterized membrane protein
VPDRTRLRLGVRPPTLRAWARGAPALRAGAPSRRVRERFLRTGVVLWIVANSLAWTLQWDPYPFILLNLAFSTQAAYAAPLILLAQTRQAARDQAHAEVSAKHMERLSEEQMTLLEENTRLTEEIRRMSEEIHRRVVPG